jgi:hypothetical protein
MDAHLTPLERRLFAELAHCWLAITEMAREIEQIPMHRDAHEKLRGIARRAGQMPNLEQIRQKAVTG